MAATPDIQEILDLANKLGDLVSSHPAVAKYKDAQKLVSADPDAGRHLVRWAFCKEPDVIAEGVRRLGAADLTR